MITGNILWYIGNKLLFIIGIVTIITEQFFISGGMADEVIDSR